MCSKGGGSPPVPNSASTSFQSTTTPAPFATPLYQDFLNRANTLSQTPFNPAMEGSVAPMNAEQTAAGAQLFQQGMSAGNFDPNKVQEIMSPFTQNVVDTTQGWFNNQNAIQGNDLLSQAIKSGNAFGGDRAGVAEGVLAGQQQLAQAPVIAGLYQSGYTQALNEYNLLKQMGLQGSQAALGWGGMEQQQSQRELDVAQQNAMMESAYPFQTLNWYGAALGGVAPLLGAQTVGFNTPPEQSGAATALGIGSAAIGLGNAAFGSSGTAAPAASSTSVPQVKHGGVIRRVRGGLVPVYIRHNGGIIPGLAYGGSSDDSDDDDQHEPSGLPKQADDRAQSEDYKPPQVGLPSHEKPPTWGSQIGQLKGGSKQTTPSTFPGMGSSSTQAQPSTAQTIGQWADVGTKVLGLGAKLAPLMLLQRGGGVRRFANGGGDDDDQLTMTDLGVLDRRGNELSPGIAGPGRGSPAGNPVDAEDMPNLARVRERFRPMLEDNAALRRKLDVNTTAEAGTDPAARDFYQGLTLDRAAARGESLPYTLSRGPGTPDKFYPATTMNATTASGRGVSPALWGGANPANYATGNASRDPVTGRDVGFAGGPQTGSVGGERGGIEGPDLAAAKRFGYRGPDTTPIGFGPGAPQGTYGGDQAAAAEAKQNYPEGAREKADAAPDKGGAAGPGGRGQQYADAGTGQVGRKIPGLAKPAPTFAQRLANDPFWQFGTALMAKPGLKRYPFQGVGAAAQSMSAQQMHERNRILDEKPQMFDDGKQLHALMPDGTLTPTGLPSPKGIEARTKAPFKIETDVPGPFGSTTKKAEYFKGYDENGNPIPFQSPAQQAQQPQTPRIAPEERPAPPAPPAQQAPAAPAAPQLRQTEAKPEAPEAPAVPAGPSGWSQDPTTGNWRDKEGAIYDKTGKVITPAPAAPAAAPAAPAAPGQQQQPAKTGLAGPDDTLKQVQSQWGSGAIKPGGVITNPAALNRNDAALEGLRPDEQRMIKGIADYSLDPNKVFAGKAAALRAPAISKVMEYDPSYNQGQYAQRNAARKAFEVNGVEARNIQSQDMAVQHAARAYDNIDALGHTRLPRVNKAIAELGKETGLTGDAYQKAVARINQDIHAVSNELMKVFRGGTGTPSEREAKRIADTLNVYDNPVALKEALKEGVELLYGRINATAYRYNDAMGPGYARPTESWMSPQGRTAVQRIMQGQ